MGVEIDMRLVGYSNEGKSRLYKEGETQDICGSEECVYEGNYDMGPWDYEVNAPVRDDTYGYCYVHAMEGRDGDDW